MSQWIQYVLSVTLEQDVILGATGATLGNLETLDYLPGSVFLGAAASRLYTELTQDEAWLLFHSGVVRFNDALPMAGSEPAWPMPLNWHYYKGEEYKTSVTLMASHIFDPAIRAQSPKSANGQDAQRQPKQLRKGYVTASGRYYHTAKSLRMKTALDTETGRAAQGQLFGYQSLESGQVFTLVIEAASVHKTLLEKAVASLTGVLRLGRSRSAQYGRVRSELLGETSATPLNLPSSHADETTLSLWLLSDLALVDDHGQPTVQPLPEYLGLPSGTAWLSDQSFLRTRRYSPYNAYRRSHDEERQVITRGSVLRYQLSKPLSNVQRATLQQGLGVYQNSGLGRVAVDTSLIGQAQPDFDVPQPWTASSAEPAMPNAAGPDTSRLLSVIQKRAQGGDNGSTAKVAQQLFDLLVAAVGEARIWQGIPADQPIAAPNRSQWGQVKALANQYRQDPIRLRNELYQSKQAIIRERSGWELEVNPRQTLARCITPELEQLQDSDFADIVGRLAVLGLTHHWEVAIQGTPDKAQENQQLGDAS